MNFVLLLFFLTCHAEENEHKKQNWLLALKTGDVGSGGIADYEGIDTTIYFTLQGDEDKDTVSIDAQADQLKPGTTAEVQFSTKFLGNITKLTVWTDSIDGWYMGSATLTDRETGKRYLFLLGEWVDANMSGSDKAKPVFAITPISISYAVESEVTANSTET